METLAEIYKRHCVTGPDVGHGDKGGTHSYIEEYETLLEPYRRGKAFMEIGLAMGLSIAMWREYMPGNLVVGVDLSFVFDTGPHLLNGTILIAADCTKPEFLEKLGSYTFDAVIDDASHMVSDQQATFQMLKPKMNPGGIYIIEDVLSVDAERLRFQTLHTNCEIRDLRHKKGRFDDVLIIYRF